MFTSLLRSLKIKDFVLYCIILAVECVLYNSEPFAMLTLTRRKSSRITYVARPLPATKWHRDCVVTGT